MTTCLIKKILVHCIDMLKLILSTKFDTNCLKTSQVIIAGVFAQITGFETLSGETTATAKCTELCGDKYGGQSYSKICLAIAFTSRTTQRKRLEPM